MLRNVGRPKKVRRGQRTSSASTSGQVNANLIPPSADAADGASGVECIAAGTTHQGGIRFKGKGVQCVAMSCIASTYSCVKNRETFTTSDIDDIILPCGDILYCNTPRPTGEVLLNPEELPPHVKIQNYSINITITWVINGLYPSNTQNFFDSIENLKNNLLTCFNPEYIENTMNFLFTGQNSTVSFWKSNNRYFLFNSHAVDASGKYNYQNPNVNVARLFQCLGINALAQLLFASAQFDESEYSIHRLTVLNIENQQIPPILIPSVPSVAQNDPKFSTLKPVVVLEKMPLNSILKRKIIESDPKLNAKRPVVVIEKIAANPRLQEKSVGRPKKQIRANNNSHQKAVEKYNKSHPEVNRRAVERYTALHPEVHRQAVERFSALNPEINRQSVARYAEAHPEINRQSVARYAQTNPDVNRLATQRHRAVRNIEPSLRNSENLIAVKSGDELNAVRLYSLRKPSLKADDVFKCLHCGTSLFFEEKSRTQWCCGSGSYNVQNFPPLTESFYNSDSFNKCPRAYNNLFAFSALGVSHGFQHPDTGLAFIKIQGRIYHRVFDLGYTNTTNPIGLYIEDNEERQRLAAGLRLDRQIVTEINHFLHEVNPLIDCFKQLHKETSQEAHLRFERTTRQTHGNILGDMPLGNEIAAIISTERERFLPRCIAIWKTGANKPHTVDVFHPLYETFQYPLLYPHATAGWYINKVDNKNAKLTQNKYVRCLLLSEPRFHDFGKLSEEWLVDMYCRIEEERLRFVSNMQNQSSMRLAPLHELQDNVETSARQIITDETVQGEGGVVPGRIYLPNTFTGGPRYMKTKYMDAIALVNRLGTPSFFLTITCNPKWIEIQQSLLPGQRPHASLCARVFSLKLAQLLKDLRSGAWFGKHMYIIYVIEFQKRGLPHAHICFRVEGGGPVQNSDIDKFVRADIPNATEAEGKLRQMVLNHMIHGPCGPSHRTDLPCWDSTKEKCSKYFPKRETEVTHHDDKGFIHLRRSSNNEAIIKFRNRDVTVNDLWVVPYNAAILLKYDCHANLEVSSARKIVKYLFKYMTKGKDEARVTIVAEEDRNNEVEQYVTKRYIGACDAAWRVFEYDLTMREPAVQQLPVHLENYQSVFFRQDSVADAAQSNSSALLDYFNRPAGDEFENLTYLDFYEKYIVHSKCPTTKNVKVHRLQNKFVTKRQRGVNVARLFWVAPNRGEQFYLRMLLALYPCRGYSDLLKIGGLDCRTFQEVARNVGIANDEIEYERALEEAANFLTGPRLRRFFVLLAVNGAPVGLLWNKFKNQITEDYLERMPNDTDRAYKMSLIQIDRLLRKHGTSLVEQGLPNIRDDTTELGREQIEFSAGRLNAYVETWQPRLSTDQRAVFEYVDRLVEDPIFKRANNSSIFIDGPAGTGKTLLLNVVAAHVRGSRNNVVLCTATSGIAAQNYEGGTTAHSMFKFPLDLVDDHGYWNITNGSQRAELIRHASVIIYDEAPMAHKYLIHLLDRSLRDLMQTHELFGGKIVIFAGDFRQIPPVVPNARNNADVVNCSVKMSWIWEQIKIFKLSTAQRSREDEEFSEQLLNIGSNSIVSVPVQTGRVTQNLIDVSPIEFVTDLDDLIDFVFSEVLDEPDVCCHRAILCNYNMNVKEINANILDRVPGELIHFYSVDQTATDDADELFLGSDTLNRMQPKGVPEHDLQLKVGCVCMIMRNLSFSDRLVNGTKVIVVGHSPRLIRVRKPDDNEDFFIPRITFKAPIDSNSPIEMIRRQFPLQICYSMTIHKSQGQTISKVGIDLRSDVFSHGQLYVALGRVRNRRDLKLLLNKNRVINNRPFVNNVVIPQILL